MEVGVPRSFVPQEEFLGRPFAIDQNPFPPLQLRVEETPCLMIPLKSTSRGWCAFGDKKLIIYLHSYNMHFPCLLFANFKMLVTFFDSRF